MQKWKIIKRLINPKKIGLSFASLPTPYLKNSDTLRIFYSPRNNRNKSYVSYSDFDKNFNLKKNKKYFVKSNSLNKNYSNGIMPSCIVKKNNTFLFYFCGWVKSTKHPFHQEIISNSLNQNLNLLKKKFRKINLTKKNDPLYVTNPFIIKVKEKYHMFYLSAVKWIKKEGRIISKYGIKVATSYDLNKWKTNKKFLFPLKNFSETAQARPIVFFHKEYYWIFYSSRKKRYDYKIKYSKSKDFLKWTKPKFCNFTNNFRWCNQMQAYPYIFTFRNNIYMLFCGNNYGRSGFGIAKLLI